MDDPNQMVEDLQFVRGVVEERQQKPALAPATVGLLWAAVVMIGCTLNDFVPRYAWIFWLTVPPAGSMLTRALVGKKMSQVGEVDHRIGRLNALHWSSIFWVSIPIGLMVPLGQIDGLVLGQLLLLISGLVWYLAGVHLDRRWMLPGFAMIAASAMLCYRHHYVWTAAGAIISVAIAVSFASPRRRENNV